MEIITKNLRRCDVVAVKGRIDASTVKEFAEALHKITDAGRYNIVVDMKEVAYISSAGLSELIDTQKTCKQLKRGELVLAEISPRVSEVLDLAGLTPLFKVFPTQTEAVGNF
ncbi:MAG: STAS domain-containing protein [Anaerolineae bacterium]|nr:STAS domain-containing protein [Anaerolineae bacterium]